jgi:hypothetical protein
MTGVNASARRPRSTKVWGSWKALAVVRKLVAVREKRTTSMRRMARRTRSWGGSEGRV